MRRLAVGFALVALGCGQTRPAPVATSPTPAPPREPASPDASPPASEPSQPALESLGLRRYAASAFALPKDIIDVVALRDEDVGDDFDNVDDLAWLEPVIERNRVVMFGENHYYEGVHHLAHRVLFALNQFDRVPFISMESPYSAGAVWDHYVGIGDDAAAAAFYDAEVARRVAYAETRAFLERIRAWNKRYPRRRIHVGTHDVEHDVDTALTLSLAPYFRSLEPALVVEYADYVADPAAALARLDDAVAVARTRRHVGPYPFMTAAYAAAVVENIRALHLGRAHDFTYYRQRAIVRNLTDPAYLGRYLRRGKAMIWAGAYHTPTRAALPDGGSFLREGAYLAHEFGPTRGKTYSIQAIGVSVALGDMAGVNLDDCMFTGSGYGDMVRPLQEAHAAGLIAPDDFMVAGGSAVADMVAAVAPRVDHAPFRVVSIDWDGVSKLAAMLGDGVERAVRGVRTQFDGHDVTIVVPRSRVVRLLPRAS